MTLFVDTTQEKLKVPLDDANGGAYGIGSLDTNVTASDGLSVQPKAENTVAKELKVANAAVRSRYG